MLVTLSNDFHRTSVRVRVDKFPYHLTPSQVRRIRRALCGMPDCTCSGWLGVRGPQEGGVVVQSFSENDYVLHVW